MANYYKTNAIYNSLPYGENFIWVSGNAWILIYGDKQSNPKIITLVYGKSWEKQSHIIEFVKFLSKNVKLPILFIEFNDQENHLIESVLVSSDANNYEEISLHALKKLFQKSGLDIKDEACAKYLNDKTSSAYHVWQRNSLGYNITVSDIDLVRLHNSKYVELIELKRSYKEVSDWKPYRDDYANFNLLYRLSVSLNLCFTIAYNQRVTKPNFSDIKEPLSIFEYTITSVTKIADKITFQDFINGIYHVYFSSNTKYENVPFCNIEIADLEILSKITTRHKEKAILELKRRNGN